MDFDKNMNKKLLDEIIVTMESKGFMIHGVVCDLGNPTLLKQLKFHKSKKVPKSKRQFYFKNPFDKSRRVYIFADAPHMLKLARNHLLDDGFKIPASDGKKIVDGDRWKESGTALREPVRSITIIKIVLSYII